SFESTPGPASWLSAVFSFLAIVIIERFAPHQSALRRPNEPFLAIRVIGRFPDRVVGDDENKKVVGPLAVQGVRFFRREDERIPGFDRRRPVLMPHDTFA